MEKDQVTDSKYSKYLKLYLHCKESGPQKVKFWSISLSSNLIANDPISHSSESGDQTLIKLVCYCRNSLFVIDSPAFISVNVRGQDGRATQRTEFEF